ncbi:reverse transcriptase domain-containing protein, partial [Tanacetum coccineum]
CELLLKEPPRSILTWEDLVSKFVNYFFPPSKTTNLKNDITNFQQNFDETFSEAWDRFKDLLRKCPHHGFSELHQINTFYNALTQSDQDSLNAAAGGNLLNRTPRDALTIIENKSKVSHVDLQSGVGYRPQGDPNYRASNQMGPPGFPPTNVQNNQNYNRYNQNQGNYQVSNNQGRGPNFNQGNNNYEAPNFQAPNYQAQVGPSNELTNYMKSNEATLRAMQTQMTNMKTELRNEFKSSLDTRTNKIENQNNQIINMLTNLTMQKQSPWGSGSLPSNTIANPIGDVKAITTRSGVAYDGPTIPPTPSPLPKEVERETELTKDKVQTTSSESTIHVQPPVVQVPISEPEVALKPNPKSSIPYPSRLNDQKLREKANNQMLKFLQIFQRLHFDLSFADALLYKLKFASTFKSLLNECFALADLDASINLIPLSVWKKLSLPKLTPTRMTLELANRSFAYLVGVAEDVFVKVGQFHFLANFVVVDYDVDPRVPLILGRPFLRTARALIDVHREELNLRYGDEHLIFHTDTTLKYPNEHRIESVKMSNFIDISCEGNFEEVLNIKKLSHHLSGSTTSIPDSSLSLAPVETRGNFVTFFNPLFDANDYFTFSDDESLPEEDIQEENFKIYSNPLFEFDEEYISSDVNPLFNEELEDIESNDSYVSNLDEPVLSVTPLSDANEDECFDPGGKIDEINAFLDMDVSTVIEVSYHDSEGDKIFLEYLLKKSASMDSSLLFSSGSEDIIFDPGIPVFSFYSLEPVVSHRSRTFMCFNVYLNILNESPIKICSSTGFVPNITMIWGESS